MNKYSFLLLLVSLGLVSNLHSKKIPFDTLWQFVNAAQEIHLLSPNVNKATEDTIEASSVHNVLMAQSKLGPEAVQFGIRITGANITGFVDCSFLKISLPLVFINCVFTDTVDFQFSSAVDVVFCNCKFLKTAFFSGLDVSRFFVKYSSFNETFAFNHTHVSMVFHGQFGVFQHADFFNAQIEGDLNLTGASFQSANFAFLKAPGQAVFDSTIIYQSLFFNNAQVGRLIFSKVNCPLAEDSILLGGFTYREILMNGGTKRSLSEDSLMHFLAFLDQASFDISNYKTFENYCRERGYSDVADDAFVLGRDRGSKNDFWDAASNFIHKLFIRNGRRPGRAFGWSLILVLLGWFVFRKKEKMEVQDTKWENRKYNAFWYSLDSLMPFVKLNSAEVWQPKHDYRWGWWYLRFHMIAGWILLTFGLAYLSGLVQ